MDETISRRTNLFEAIISFNLKAISASNLRTSRIDSRHRSRLNLSKLQCDEKSDESFRNATFGLLFCTERFSTTSCDPWNDRISCFARQSLAESHRLTSATWTFREQSAAAAPRGSPAHLHRFPLSTSKFARGILEQPSDR